MPAPPRHELGQVVVGDLGNQLVLAEELDQHADERARVWCARKVLRVLGVVAPRNIIEPERGTRGFGLLDKAPCALARLPLYRFGFALRGLFGRAVKAM